MSSIKQFLGGSAAIATILAVDLILIQESPVPATAVLEDMVHIDTGEFLMGSERGMPDESPVHEVSLSGFWIDRYEVSNARFAEFVAATGHVTAAEEYGDSLVFSPPQDVAGLPGTATDWWQLRKQATWRQPDGLTDVVESYPDHPVVQVNYADAEAYCQWRGKELPTEAQFEYAARGGAEGMLYSWGDAPLHRHQAMTNHWQGQFPYLNENTDGYAGTAPVGSFPANDFGLFDITGNVWEWVQDWYHPRYYAMSPGRNPAGVSREESLDPAEPHLPKRSIRGGSFLCSENYCSGFRVSARMPADPLSSTNHTGFRCVVNEQTSLFDLLSK